MNYGAKEKVLRSLYGRVSLPLGKNSRCGLRARKRERLLCLTKQAWSSIMSLPLFSLREICGFFPLAYSLTLPPQM